MMIQKLYTSEHDQFRDTVRKFFAKEVVPFHDQWEKDGIVPRSLWARAGELGFLCPTMPEAYGGAGVDFLYSVILIEEQSYALCSGPGWGLHNDIVAPYILHYGTEEQKRKWLPLMATGEVITAIAMTEPGAGSDLQGVRTTAIRDGDEYVVNGQKTFITNGQNADMIIVVCKTTPGEGAKGTSLVMVEANREGFSRGRNLEKIGMKAQDTSELFFQDVRVPKENLLGPAEGMGFFQLMQELPQERLQIAIVAQAAAEKVLELTIAYTKERKAFGKPVFQFQNTRFQLAELKAQVTAGRAWLNHCIALHLEKKLDVATAAMAKMWFTDMQCQVIDACLQLHGGYGYMWEYPVARAYADARVQKIYGGTNEIMKELISRSL